MWPSLIIALRRKAIEGTNAMMRLWFPVLAATVLQACATAPAVVRSTEKTSLRPVPPTGNEEHPPGQPIEPGKELTVLESRLDDRMEEGQYWLLLVKSADGAVGWVVADDTEATASTPDEIVFNVELIHNLPYEWVCDAAEMIRTGDAGYWFASGRKNGALTARARTIGADGYWAAASMYRDLSSSKADALFNRAENLLAPLKAGEVMPDDRKAHRAILDGIRDRKRHEYTAQCEEFFLPLAPGTQPPN